MNSKSFLVGISSFFRVLEKPKSSKELFEEASKLCNEANDGLVSAQKTIAATIVNEESPLYGFFVVTGVGLYVLTDLAKYESTRGSVL